MLNLELPQRCLTSNNFKEKDQNSLKQETLVKNAKTSIRVADETLKSIQ